VEILFCGAKKIATNSLAPLPRGKPNKLKIDLSLEGIKIY
jgi:hypothetical protein